MLEGAEQQVTAQASAASNAPTDMQAAMSLYFDGFRAFLDSAESLDLALLEDAEELALHAVYTAFEDSDLDGWGGTGALPEKLPGALDAEAQFAVVMVADWADLTKRVQPLVETMFAIYPAELMPGFEAYWASLSEAYALLGDTMVFSGDFGEQGMHFSATLEAEQSKAFVEKLLSTITSASALMTPLGVTLGAPQEVEVGGLKAQQWPATLDYHALAQMTCQPADPEVAAKVEEFLRRMYGEHLTATIAEQAGRVCVSVGGSPAELEQDFARFAAGPVPAAPFLAGLHGLPAAPHPLLAYRMDFGKLMAAVAPLIEAQGAPPSPFPADVPFELTTWFGIEGRRWHAGLGARQDELAGMVKAFEEK
jgi:hypothetical protein